MSDEIIQSEMQQNNTVNQTNPEVVDNQENERILESDTQTEEISEASEGQEVEEGSESSSDVAEDGDVKETFTTEDRLKLARKAERRYKKEIQRLRDENSEYRQIYSTTHMKTEAPNIVQNEFEIQPENELEAALLNIDKKKADAERQKKEADERTRIQREIAERLSREEIARVEKVKNIVEEGELEYDDFRQVVGSNDAAFDEAAIDLTLAIRQFKNLSPDDLAAATKINASDFLYDIAKNRKEDLRKLYKNGYLDPQGLVKMMAEHSRGKQKQRTSQAPAPAKNLNVRSAVSENSSQSEYQKILNKRIAEKKSRGA